MTKLPQPLSERLDEMTGARWTAWSDQTDLCDLRRLLRGRERSSKNIPTHHTEERAPVHHWMISSARTRTDGGIVRPSALAVLALITSSNLVGCSTGRSAGLAPLRIFEATGHSADERPT